MGRGELVLKLLLPCPGPRGAALQQPGSVPASPTPSWRIPRTPLGRASPAYLFSKLLFLSHGAHRAGFVWV